MSTGNGVSTENVAPLSAVDELVGNKSGRGTGRIKTNDFAKQLLAETPLKDAVTAAAEGMLQFDTWAKLSSVAGTKAGQGARVLGPDLGTHADPVVGGAVANEGEYSWSATPSGWHRIGSTSLQDLKNELLDEVAARSDLIEAANSDIYVDVLVDQTGAVVESTDIKGRKTVVSLNINDAIDFEKVDGLPFAEVITDQTGAIIEVLRDDGTRLFSAFGLANGYEEFTQDIPGYREVHIDQQGNIIFALLDSGVSIFAGDDTAPVDPEPEFVPGFSTEIVMCISYGQSWAGGTSGKPAITLTQRYNSLMFNAGVRPRIDGQSTDPTVTMASLVPLVEANAPADGAQGETPASGFCEAAIELIATEDGIAYTDHQYQFMVAAPALGGQPIGNLSKGSSTYTYLMQCIEQGYARARELGKTFSVPALHWWQGEGNYALGPVDKATYLSALRKLRSDIDADIRAMIPNHPPVFLIVNQSLSHGVKQQPLPSVDLAMLEAGLNDPFIVLAGPMYAYPAADNGHYTARSYKHMGAIAGLAYKRTVIDGKKWLPLHPLEKIYQGNTAVIRMHVPVKPLVLDTALVNDPGNYGFTAVGPGGEARTISSVSIIGPDRIKLTADGAIGEVRYAWQGGIFTGPLTGPRGCLRDSQGETTRLDPDGLNLPLHNWCSLF
ncbi:hypothetical protein [Brucella pituitosa]|uniref:hypothetical protein n=1 Tax=Brucella pituitosa TaxID=571256 RepID=UPI003F4AA2C3